MFTTYVRSSNQILTAHATSARNEGLVTILNWRGPRARGQGILAWRTCWRLEGAPPEATGAGHFQANAPRGDDER